MAKVITKSRLVVSKKWHEVEDEDYLSSGDEGCQRKAPQEIVSSSRRVDTEALANEFVNKIIFNVDRLICRENLYEETYGTIRPEPVSNVQFRANRPRLKEDLKVDLRKQFVRFASENSSIGGDI